MSAYGISPSQVKAAVLDQNSEIPDGNVTYADRELTLRTLGRIETIDEFANIIVAAPSNTPIFDDFLECMKLKMPRLKKGDECEDLL